MAVCWNNLCEQGFKRYNNGCSVTVAKVHLLASPFFCCSSRLCSVSMVGQTEHVEFLVFTLKVAPNSVGALGGPALAVSAHFLS